MVSIFPITPLITCQFLQLPSPRSGAKGLLFTDAPRTTMDWWSEPHNFHRTEGNCCTQHPMAPELPGPLGLPSELDPLGAIPHAQPPT